MGKRQGLIERSLPLWLSRRLRAGDLAIAPAEGGNSTKSPACEEKCKKLLGAEDNEH
jgi:hypothetical protein